MTGTSHHQPSLRLLIGLCLTCLLLACGGGSQVAGGVGSGGSGLAEGTVTGFGSVIVDGVRYDDSGAQISVEDEAGQKQTTALALGQRVRLTLDAAGKAASIEVLPQLMGPVTATAQGEWLRVAGQWVRVESGTVLVEHDSAGQIPLGAEVEVHGTWQTEATRGAVLVAAMLRERGVAPEAPVLLGGVVHSLNGRTATLGSAQGTAVTLPADTPLPAVGDVVALWVARPVVHNPSAPGPWPVLRQRQAPEAREGSTLVLGGAVRAAEGRRLNVQGLELDWPDKPGAQALPPQPGDIVRLTLQRVNDRWQVQAAEVRDEPAKLGGRVELRGRLSGVNWSARPLELTLRGVRVMVAAPVLEASGCAGTGTFDIELKAARGRLPMQALELRCSPAAPG